jgi:outer membrane immunogenic protein
LNKAFLASVLIAMSMTVPAMAADMPLKAPIYAPPIVYIWTGCYIGANAGYAWGHSDVNYAQTGAYSTYPPAYVAFADSLGSPKIAMSGFTGGGQIGCNYQAGSFVFAIEGDGDYVGLSGTAAALATVPVFLSVNSSSASVSSHSLFTVRPRIGYAVDRTLFYVTGGYAAGNVSYSEIVARMLASTISA